MPDYNVYQQPIRRVDRDGDTVWQLPSGALHRLDGPAVERADGTKAWYIEGQELTEQQWTLEVCRRMRDE